MVEPVMVTDPDGLRVLRHSCAHVMAQAVQDVFPEAKLGIGPPIENGFYYEFDVAEPFDPGGPGPRREAHGRDRQVGPEVRPPGGVRGRRARRARRRALQVPARRQRGRRGRHGGRRRRADHLRQRRPALRRDGLGRPLPRPARPDDPDDRPQRVQGHALLGGLLAGQPGQRAAAAHLRHRVAGQGRAARPPHVPRGGRQARPPPPRPELDLFSFPDEIGSGPGRVPPQGRHHAPHHGGLLAAPARDRRVRVRLHPAHHQGAAVRDLRAPRVVRGRHVPADA